MTLTYFKAWSDWVKHMHDCELNGGGGGGEEKKKKTFKKSFGGKCLQKMVS